LETLEDWIECKILKPPTSHAPTIQSGETDTVRWKKSCVQFSTDSLGSLLNKFQENLSTMKVNRSTERLISSNSAISKLYNHTDRTDEDYFENMNVDSRMQARSKVSVARSHISKKDQSSVIASKQYRYLHKGAAKTGTGKKSIIENMREVIILD
jgi:hypothetical protein